MLAAYVRASGGGAKLLHVFWNTLDLVNLDTARASLGRVYAQSGRQSRTRRVRDTPPVQELHASIDRGVRARVRGPGRGLGTSAPTKSVLTWP